jgi:hypothetical protein
MTETEAKGKEIEEAFNELIAKCAEYGGHVYIKDKLNNDFILRITEPIRLSVYEGYKGAQDEEK